MKKFAAFTLIALGLVFIAPQITLAEEVAQVTDQTYACMEKCIRDNGKDEKSTCKSSCAGSIKRGPQKDCGIAYKECRTACDKKDKGCKKQCKKAQRSCI